MTDIKKIQDIFDWSSGIISAVSFFASLIVIRVFYLKRLQKNLTNQFVMQLILSEMINNLNHVSPIISYFIGRKEEKYYERFRVCFSQIYVGLFTNFYTLFSSFLISFRIYDLLVNNSMTFRKQKNVTIARILSFYLCALIAYVLWFLQVEIFQNYSGSGKFFRVLTCWVGIELDCVSLVIFGFFIILTFIYCIKSRSFVQSYQKRLYEDDDDLNINDANSSKSLEEMQKIKVVQKRLVLYPIVTTILYSLIIVYRVLSYLKGDDDTIKIVCLALYSLTSVLRGIIFIIIYFGTQQVFRDGLYEFFTCKTWQEKKIIPEKLNLEDMYEE